MVSVMFENGLYIQSGRKKDAYNKATFSFNVLRLSSNKKCFGHLNNVSKIKV